MSKVLNNIEQSPLERTLREHMFLMEQKKEILDQHIKDGTSVILDTKCILMPEEITLMLLAKTKTPSTLKKRESGEDYRPFLLHTERQMEEFNTAVREMVSFRRPFVFNCIYRGGGDTMASHCTPVQVYSDGRDIRVFSLDAAGDHTNFQKIRDLATYDWATRILNMYAGGGIQKSNYGCAIFSIQDLNTLSNMSIGQKDSSLRGNQFNNTILDPLDPRFFRNIQSLKALEEYQKTHHNVLNIGKEGQKNLGEHIQNYSITVDVSEVGDRSEIKVQNRAIDYKTHKYIAAALAQFESLKSAGGLSRVNDEIYKMGEFYDKNTAKQNDKNLSPLISATKRHKAGVVLASVIGSLSKSERNSYLPEAIEVINEIVEGSQDNILGAAEVVGVKALVKAFANDLPNDLCEAMEPFMMRLTTDDLKSIYHSIPQDKSKVFIELCHNSMLNTLEYINDVPSDALEMYSQYISSLVEVFPKKHDDILIDTSSKVISAMLSRDNHEGDRDDIVNTIHNIINVLPEERQIDLVEKVIESTKPKSDMQIFIDSFPDTKRAEVISTVYQKEVLSPIPLSVFRGGGSVVQSNRGSKREGSFPRTV